MNSERVIIGYYICMKSECPSFTGFSADRFLSVSDCLCDHEPQIFRCHGWGKSGDDKEYRHRYFADEEEYIQLSLKLRELFENGLFCSDGRFMRREDAVYFYTRLFKKHDCTLVAVSTDKEYASLAGDKDFSDKYEKYSTDMEVIGCDVIGWDISVFHSFLCNSLHKRFDGLKFSRYGLLDADLSAAKNIASEIQGKGEPVDWIPVEICKPDIT